MVIVFCLITKQATPSISESRELSVIFSVAHEKKYSLHAKVDRGEIINERISSIIDDLYRSYDPAVDETCNNTDYLRFDGVSVNDARITWKSLVEAGLGP